MLWLRDSLLLATLCAELRPPSFLLGDITIHTGMLTSLREHVGESQQQDLAAVWSRLFHFCLVRRDNLSIISACCHRRRDQICIQTQIRKNPNHTLKSSARHKNAANPVLPLPGKPWESKQTECKVNTIIHRLCMWSVSDQPRGRLSARGDGWGGSFKILWIQRNNWSRYAGVCRKNVKHVTAGAVNKTDFFFF